MATNDELSGAFEMLGKLMELHGENSFKAKSYLNAAFQIGKLSTEVETMEEAQVTTLPGVGKAVYEKIKQFEETGTITALQDILAKTPVGILEIMTIKGLGPKKVGTIWKELNIESIGELEYACHENRLTLLKGFGEKTQQSVLANIEFQKSSKGKILYADAEQVALGLETKLQQFLAPHKIMLSGQFRMRKPILENILFVTTADEKSVATALDKRKITYELNTGQVVLTSSMIPVAIRIATEETFHTTLFETSSADVFVERVKARKADYAEKSFKSEEEIFSYIGIKNIEPEMREGLHELNWIEKYDSKDLVDYKDVKGVVHNHSKWSDGATTIKEMAEYCIKQGFEYLVMSDHSQSAVYANGLTPERIFQQHVEINELNKQLAPFKIYKSIESDILYDGSLDYTDDVLKTFDLVIASVHSTLKMNEEKATSRVIKAIENPYTTILGHPTGRLLLSRPGYPLDHIKVIDACAANEVIIELNANPWRLDLDWQWIYYAMEKGVQVSINPDAHNLQGIHDIHYGVLAARKGGLVKSMLFNGRTRIQMDEYLSH